MGNRNVVIVDYGLGNLHSVNKAVALVGGNPVITGDKEIIAAAEKLILPGVGAFGDCMANLEKAGVIPVIKEYIAADKPFLGICLGMQVLFEESEEAPGVKGLGVFPGKVVLIPTSLKIPHMGWNQLNLKTASPLLILPSATTERKLWPALAEVIFPAYSFIRKNPVKWGLPC